MFCYNALHSGLARTFWGLGGFGLRVPSPEVDIPVVARASKTASPLARSSIPMASSAQTRLVYVEVHSLGFRGSVAFFGVAQKDLGFHKALMRIVAWGWKLKGFRFSILAVGLWTDKHMNLSCLDRIYPWLEACMIQVRFGLRLFRLQDISMMPISAVAGKDSPHKHGT